MMQSTEESPLQKRYWSSVVDFLKDHLQAGETLIAPLAFKQKFSGVQHYTQNLKSAADYDWVVL
ncbi:MAG: hypothetical protein F6K28_54075, partial [Microcoleus sp. SIO2G3]|nr:hypothetical protein [Microcoleus sp. SIO2G3]